ncbi:hypothetical protein QTA57_13855 [Fontisubflavum oceani]|uniref:hypothetical protein n=1 Tax=Fontisubflavum oceani TaxID=2978973 RepID=UPI0025B579C2|nr:hypothetical protein [Fontisubflavum oceani]WJY20884.1 hypothetical protein QTA57_13855 [Fontisubflavum oceani]
MANTDSFIDEVSEEVRRERLFRILKKWGWVAALAILILVGGAAWNEYRNAQDTQRAEAFGDTLLTAFDNDDADARLAALAEVPAETPEAEIVLALLQAGEEAGEGAEAAAARLRALAGNTDLARRYRDLALLKAQMLSPEEPSMAMATMDRLAQPGAPYRALAMEQQAYIRFSEGDVDAGIDLLRQAQDDPQATLRLQQRAMQLIVALEAGAVLADPSDAVETAPVEDDSAPAMEEDTSPSDNENGSDDAVEDAASQ